MKKSLLPYVLVASIGIVAGVGITAVVEDSLGMPFTQVDFDLFDPENVNLEALIEMIAEHPEWADSIFDWIKEHPDILADMDPSSLADLIGEHPELAGDILENLAGQLSPEELADLLNDPDLADLLANNPELAALAAGYLISQMGDIDFPEELPEPTISNGGSINGSLGGGGNGSIDDGSLNPELYTDEIFSFDSSYAGTIYLRSASLGDYSSEKRGFLEAPEFDPSTYYVSPLLFSGLSIRQSYSTPRQARLEMHMGSFRDEGMIVGDYSNIKYSTSDGDGKFSRQYENRLGRIDYSDYTVSCYPEADLSDYAIPASLAQDEYNYSLWVKENYLDVPSSILNNLRGFLEQNRLRTPKDIETFLKSNYTYEVGGFSCPSGQDIVLTFLNEKKVGTCTNFASAMTLLCRALGTPARFVTGYMVNAKTGYNSVLGNMGHAWTEVYQSGAGWKRYDATAAVSKKRTDQVEASDDKMIREGEMENFGRPAERTLFYVDNDFDVSGTIYLRERAFDKYDYQSKSFLPLEANEEDLEWMDSLNFKGQFIEEYGPQSQISSYRPEKNRLRIIYGSDYVPYGDIVPEVPVVSNAQYEYQYDIAPGSANGLVTYDDSRYLSNGVEDQLFYFYNEDDADFLINQYFALKTDEARAYRSNILATDYYSDIPTEIVNDIGSLRRFTVNTMGNDEATSINTFFARYMHTDSPLAGEEAPRLDWDGLSGDPFALAMSSDTLHMAKRHNVLVGLEVMLLRYVGYRARLVEGYRVDLSPELYEYGVGEKDSHAWVEYFDEDVGIWRRLDPYTAEEERNVRDVEVFFPDEHVPYEGEGEYRPSGLVYTFFDPNDHKELQIDDEPAFTFHSASKLTREGKVRIKLNTSASRMYNIFNDDVTRYYNLKNSSDSGFLYVGGDNVYMSVSYVSPQPDVSFVSPSETKIENKKRR